MRFTKYIPLFLMFLMLFSCDETKVPKKTNVYAFIPPQTTYIFRVNNDRVLADQKLVMLTQFVDKPEQTYLNNLHFKTPFTINVLQNNSKMKGFIAIGKTANVDSIFNGKKYTYEQHDIFEESFKKKHFYATQIEGQTFVSDQKLFIENCIRQQESLGKIAAENIFQSGVKTLDDNADINLIVHLPKLENDIFYRTNIPVAQNKWADWEFYDLMDVNQQVYSGMSMAKDSIQMFIKNFADLQTVKNENKQFIPYTASEIISFSFADYADFFNKYALFFKNNNQLDDKLLGLTGISFFAENSNKAIVLATENTDEFLGEEPIKVMSIADVNLYKCSDEAIINRNFSNLFPQVKVNFFTVIDGHIVLAESKSYLQKIINDYQNGSTITNEAAYQKLATQMPENFNIEMINTRIKIAGKQYMTIRSYSSENGNIFVNYALTAKTKNVSNGLVEQVLSYELKDKPKTKPQLVYNYKTKQYNIIYQNDEKEIVLINLKGKVLWKTKVKGWVVGQFYDIDLFRNHKKQYTFVTTHNWYVIDRLGRIVEGFPEHFIQKITQGISVFDYEHNRKYRFGITQSNKFRLYNSKAEKVKGFKVKTDDDILFTPQHFRIGNKDFIQIQDDKGKLYLLNRRGETRIKVAKTFDITTNNWGVYHKKFVNIDDNGNIISIDLNGKIKSAKMDLEIPVLSRIKDQTLTAVSNNKLLIDKNIVPMDLGNYSRPFILKNKQKKYIILSNADNQKIYAYDAQGKLLSKFPIIGQEVLDVKVKGTEKYLLAYYNQQNIIIYKF